MVSSCTACGAALVEPSGSASALIDALGAGRLLLTVRTTGEPGARMRARLFCGPDCLTGWLLHPSTGTGLYEPEKPAPAPSPAPDGPPRLRVVQ